MSKQKEVSRMTLIKELDPSLESRISWFQHMQKTQAVRYRPEYNLWEVFCYKDVQQVLLDYDTFSAENGQPESLPFVLGKSDPPHHRQLRSLVSKVFTPRRIEELTPRLSKIVDELLERVIAKGKMNVVTELAHPLPVRVISAMLGLPSADQERFRKWASQLSGQSMGAWKLDHSELLNYFSDLLDERKRDPRDDLISALLTAEENGAYLTHEKKLFLCVELMT